MPSPASVHGAGDGADAGAGASPPLRRISRGATTVAALIAFAAAASCASVSGSVVYGATPPNASPGSTASVPGLPSAGIGRPRLPEPTGSRPVGTTSLYLKDGSRTDPWVPGVKARELMVSLWYPAKTRRGNRAPYMTAKESELILKGGEITGVPYDALSRTRANALVDAAPAGREHSLPLVVLSPGFTEPRSSLTALAEELASRGYVVAGIDHTYESLATTFPDGRVTTCVACEAGKSQEFWNTVGRSRAADVSFVLDELIGTHPRWKGASLIARSRVAMAGHSAGGASTIAAMLQDTRIRAGIDMDGTTFAPIPDSGLSRPFLFLGTRAMHSPGGKDTTWDRDWAHLTGWKRWLVVTGAEHVSFTDTALLVEQLGIYRNPGLPGARAVEITRSHVAAFFDLHLRHRPQPLLDKPSTRHPEVRLCDVERKTCD
ncbi:alpha/beta hydrolase [Microbispora cellulosiformans]|uniref:Alpha/beta hydrolase n=1 Tax=Microbispora cellulosiformans TaxID=2614688 RepID=A0A5J5JSN9_9ACTN|nr:alpha/beta hydrolase [Microbispora cellulosiformans]